MGPDTYTSFIFYSKNEKIIKTLVKDVDNLCHFWPDYCNKSFFHDLIDLCKERQEYCFRLYMGNMKEDDVRELKKNVLSIYQNKIKCAIRYIEFGDSIYCRIDDETNFYYPENYFVQFSVDCSDDFIDNEFCTTPKDVIDRIEKYITSLTILEKLLILKSFDSKQLFNSPEKTIEKILQKRFKGEDIFLELEDIYHESF